MLESTKVILASASPRRRELLSKLGLEFEVITSKAEEKTNQSAPCEIVKDLAYIKAQDVLRQIMNDKGNFCDKENPLVMIIGADTVVAKNDCIMGKPMSETEAFGMIHTIQGSTHQVYTGVAVLLYDFVTKNLESKIFAECTDVTVFPMTEMEINSYIASGECMDKAGGYGIQGAFGVFVEKIAGDYNNVVGLPLARLYQVLHNK